MIQRIGIKELEHAVDTIYIEDKDLLVIDKVEKKKVSEFVLI